MEVNVWPVLKEAIDFLWPIVAAGAVWVVHSAGSKIAPHFLWVLVQGRVNDITHHAVRYAYNALPGADYNVPLTVPKMIASVVETAIARIKESAPKLYEFVGAEQWRKMVIARMQIAPELGLYDYTVGSEVKGEVIR